MLAFLGNQRGNITIALALSIIGIMSGITMASIAFGDTMGTRFDFDAVQELHLLRSESARGQTFVEKMDYSGNRLALPVKLSTIVGSHNKTLYRMTTKIEKENISTGGGLYFASGYTIKSLVKANRGTSTIAAIGTRQSMVSKYAELGIRRNSFAGYHYFTDNETSMNGTPVYFYGSDQIYGKVHSNTDIHIKNVNGWPTFFDVVYTSGVIVPHNGTPDYNQVFRKKYFEHAGQLVFNPTATDARAHGQRINGSGYDPHKISFVTMTGPSFTSLIGTIVSVEIDTADVWTQYPPRAGNYRFKNRFVKVDTLWTPGQSGSVANGSAFVDHKLWIRGEVYGHQTWCSADTMYLVDDVYYRGTTRGQAPDDPARLNRTDMLGLISEKSIVIQYGYADSTGRHHPNCDGDAEGIFIYGALCALGDGGDDMHKDGVFTFEYQHPHPSTPAVRLGTNPYVWDNIDLHRYKYPQATSAPWPANIDYPWYNPLWPERFPYMERGKIHLYGSVAQRRRGYVHRGPSDPDYPNDDGVWDIPSDYCGGTSGLAITDPVLGFNSSGVNAPNTSGSGVGYDKDYHFDNRLSFGSPPDFPDVHIQGGLTPFESEAWLLKRPPSSF